MVHLDTVHVVKDFRTKQAVSEGTGAQKPLLEFLHQKLCSYGKNV